MGQRDAQVWTASVGVGKATSETELIDAMRAQLGQSCPVSAADLEMMAGPMDGAEGGTVHVAIAEVDDD